MAAFYKRSKGNAGLDGVQFQVGISTVFLLNASRKFKGWRISTENEVAGKFDDLVIEFSDGSAVLLQAKHKDGKRINKDQLLSDNSRNADFSLPKYFLSYQEIKSQFNVRNIIICTNADVDKKKLGDILNPHCATSDSILYYECQTCSYMKFNENILSSLKKNAETYYDKNLQGKGIDKAVITDENIKDFLEKLQFFSGYPSKSNLDKVIDNLLLNVSKLWKGTSTQEIYEKVEDWFKDERGEYLNETLANTMFCEIRSDKYRKTLEDYRVSFACMDFSFTEGKRMFYIGVDGRYFLQVLKIYHALQEKQTLYISPDEDAEVHKLIIEAFDSSDYEFLVLVMIKYLNQRLVSDVNSKIKDIFDMHSYKKVVIISNREYVQQIAHNDILELDGTVTWKTLTSQCRERLSCKNNINFQGINVSLEELLTSVVEEYDKATNSEVLEKLVKDEKVQVGKRPGDLDEDTARYYVSRKFERDIEETGEDLFITGQKKETVTEEDIFGVKEKAILISNGAGMGKSTVLTKLGTEMKKKNPLSWILRIELNDYSRVLMDTMRKGKDTITLKELLNSNAATKLISELEEYLMSMPDRVVLMLDGFDEICPQYDKLILNLIRNCYVLPNIARIIVTTRPNESLELERILQVKPFTLQPFTREDQIAFLTSYWGHHLELNPVNKDRCEKYAVALINKMSSWMNAKNNFAAVPLQIKMLAEIFQENFKWNKDSTEWESCKEFIFGKEQEPILPERMNLIKLFDMFIDKKFDLFLDKANPTGTAIINSLFTSNFSKYSQNHQSLALKVVLGIETMQGEIVSQLFSRVQYDKSVEAEVVKIGVVHETNEDIEFVHMTFAEYFVAKSVIDVSLLDTGRLNQDKYFQMVFIDLILSEYKLTVIRSFIESILVELMDFLPPNSLETYQSLVTGRPDSRISRSQFLHLLAKEGCLSIMRLIIKSIGHSASETQVTEYDENVNHNTMNVLKSVIEKAGVNIKDSLGNTPLHYASNEGYFDVVKYLVYDCNTPEGSVSVVNDMKLLLNHRVDINAVGKGGYTALHLAAGEGHLKIVRFLEEVGADINIGRDEGYTTLHSAAVGGHLEVVKFLMQRGLDADLRDDKGFTALHLASLGGHLDVVKYLVDSGADISVTEHKGLSVLHCAAIREKLEVVRFFEGLGLDINARSNSGMTILMLAVLGGDIRDVTFILGCGVDVDAYEKSGYSALHLAAERGRLDIVKLLVQHGANVNAVNKAGFSVLHSAAEKGYLDVVKFLIDSGGLVDVSDDEEYTTLHAASLGGHLDIVKFIIDCGVDINAIDKDGCTSLYYASEKGHFKTVKLLVDCGAHVNIRSMLGFTALYMAAQGGHSDIINFLVDHKANVNTANNRGFTPLHAACIMGHLDTVKFFVQHKINVDVRNQLGITPLHSAARYGHLDIVEYLLNCGADVNETNHAGCFTALHMASQEGHLEVVKRLVVGGAQVSGGNHDGFTALLMATQRGHLDVVKYFIIETGVDVNVTNNDGVTVLQSACSRGHLDIVKFLLQLGLDVNAISGDGITSLHLAVQHGHLDTVRYLVQCGANVNAVDDLGRTLLDVASLENHVDIVGYLKECDVRISDVQE